MFNFNILEMKKIKFMLFLATVLVLNISFVSSSEKIGVLILAHGGKHSSWDATVKSATKELEKEYLVEVAFGMANPVTMQEAINKLEQRGVTKIVVVPLFISSYSPIIRQNEYLLGFREKLADPPMMMHHGSGHTYVKKGNHSNHDAHPVSNHKTVSHNRNNKKEKRELKQLQFTAKIYLTDPLDSHPVVANIIYERILELSKKPLQETILIVAHGPNDEEDNKMWVKTIDKIADQIRALQKEKGENFKQIFGLTIRDDANKEIYEQAKEHLRSLVYQSGKNGDVIVIPLLLAQGGVEDKFVKRLEGLDYKWSGKTLLPHPYITDFIKQSVKEALKN